MNNYNLLIQRLDAFIRKYYANKLLRGIIIFLAGIIALYLLISVGEYFFYFPSWLRYSLVGIFGVISLASLAIWVIAPLLKMSKLGKIISHHQAAEIIGNHFPNVKDKLLNILQLSTQSENVKSKELIIASIEQKTKELSPIPFTNAVSLKANKKYLPYLSFPLLIGAFILLASPRIFTESAERLLQPDKSFAPQAPFTFEWVNKKKAIPQFEDITIIGKTKGSIAPENVSILINGQQIAMRKKENGSFTHTIHKLSKPTNFQLTANGFLSKEYKIGVLPNPIIKDFSVSLNYPAYTGKKDEVLNNIGDVVVPQGTNISWRFKTEHTDKMLFGFSQYPTQSMAKNGNTFSINKTFYRDTSYSISLSNSAVKAKGDLKYQVSVIPDQFPSINVNQYNDSLTENFVLFVGDAGDDYGISSVALQYTISSENGRKKNGRIPMKIQAGTFTQFEYFLDVEELNLSPGDKLQYYFNACDNDGVNGSKCAKSAVFNFEKPSLKKLDSIVDKTQKEINKDLKKTAKQNEKVDKDIENLKKNLLEKKSLDWKDKKKLEQLVQKNAAIQKQIESIKNKFQKNIKQSQEKNFSEELKDKQKSVENLLEDLKDNKLAERMKKIEELMKMLNKQKLFEELQKSQDENLQMEKDLDRMLELMKQLERDMRMEDLANKAEDLAKKEEDLNKKTEQNLKSKDELKKEQDQLNKKMDELKKDLDELNELNKETATPQDMKGANEKQEQAENEMKKSSEQLSKGSKSKASKAQKNAKKNLEDMAAGLKQMAGGGGAEQTEIDIRATRQILSNLLRMSFGQETLMADVKKTRVTDPTFVSNVQKQYKLKDDSKMIADSLFALSKRLFEISSFVNKETAKINSRMTSSISGLEARNIRRASVNQQYVMTSTNNLALMLNELLDQLQKKQAQQQAAGMSGSCNKPGNKPGKKPGKKPGQGMGMQLSDIITKQQQLGSAMKQMMDKMGQNSKGKKGNNPKGKPGQSKTGNGKKGQGKKSGNVAGNGEEEKEGGSEEIAKMAAQQSMLRKQLDDINNSLIKNGKSNPELTRIKSEMDRIETELVNKRITQDLLNRQSTILTRLLKAKNALREQDQGEERESQSGKEITRQIPESLKKILKDKQSAVEYYKTVPPSLKPYYKNLVEEYFKMIK